MAKNYVNWEQVYGMLKTGAKMKDIRFYLATHPIGPKTMRKTEARDGPLMQKGSLTWTVGAFSYGVKGIPRSTATGAAETLAAIQVQDKKDA